MSQNSDDTPTGPIGVRGGSTDAAAPSPRWSGTRDLVAVALLVAAVFLPWNLYFGIGIPNSDTTQLVAVIVVSVLSLAAVALTRVGPGTGSGRLRLALNIPYLVLVLAFVGFDAVETIRSGGTVHVPGGVGPGAWLGVSGALLSAQPAITGAEDRGFGKWLRAAQIIGYASIAGAALSFAFNLFWRIKFALHGGGGASGFGRDNAAVAITAVVYGVVALTAVVVASRWLVSGTKAARLATSALGLSSLVAGVLVWLLPAGREIDAFHGIAQNTSTAGVGFEGYLAWAAAGAIFAPRTLFGAWSAPTSDQNAWREAARKGLLLIAVWCFGSALMRGSDLLVTVLLDWPFSPYDSLTLAAFDLASGGLAIWLRVNLARRTARPASALCGALASFTIARVVVGIVLAPRFDASSVPPNPVYGNNLAQQITSTFDVTLCGLALGIFGAALITGRRARRRTVPGVRRVRRVRRGAAHARGGSRPAPARPTQPGVPAPVPPGPSVAATTRIATGNSGDAPTSVISVPGRAPRIFRSSGHPGADATRQMPAAGPKIYRRPDGS